MKQNNTLAVIVWVIGLLGCSGFINEFGFFALLIPLLFWLFGNKFTKQHCKAYFNVLITAVILYFLGYVLNWLIGLFTETFDLTFIALIYFALMSILGLIFALQNKRYKPILSANVLK
ncbi:MAG: hypothetical protein K0Q49_266 [Haloplasmataceae bacterium]|jgi:antibiotic biosynthesis monooxygenase (ABM) superfamily enzyme|nr:hypothetical protein [Haloplasmataceae bacterium]